MYTMRDGQFFSLVYSGVWATEKGLNVLDSVLPDLLACLNLHTQPQTVYSNT